jgi:3-oxoacyl-[acyl-carrier-protein] synthase II
MIPAATIHGSGAVTPIGRDLNEISRKLGTNPGPPPKPFRVSDELLVEPKIARSMRRADRFIRMAAVAALDAWTPAETSCAGVAKEQIGLIVTSGLGPHCRGFKFLDGILDHGDSDALPTDFSHSVHGAAASYIAGLLDLRGPSLTTTDFEIGFEQAILLAQCWLHQGTCQRVLVGAVEELGDTLIQMASQIPQGNNLSPGEGAVFLMLGNADVPGLATINADAPQEPTDLMAIDDPPILPRDIPSKLITARNTVTFSPYFGHSASSSAFQLLGGLLSVAAHRPLGKPIGSTPQSTTPAIVDNATTFRTSCGRAATLRVTTR